VTGQTSDGRVEDPAYEHEIFISYRRSDAIGGWVKNHFVPRLTLRLNEIAPQDVRIFCDFKMQSGTRWPDELKWQLRRSGLLLPIWSADYFRSDWCVAEWRSFRKREEMLKWFTAEHPLGLVYPVRYADGDYFDLEAKETQCKRDFSRHNYPDEAFRASAKYIEFDDIVKEMAEELVLLIQNLPPCRGDFPIEEPAPLRPTKITRPVL
jgi:hypothetical protein